MQIRYDAFTVSKVGGETLDSYLFAQVYADANGVEWELAKEEVRELPSSELRNFLIEHKGKLMHFMIRNIRSSVAGEPIYLNLPAQEKPPLPYAVMKKYNKLVWYGHFVMVGVIFALLIWMLVQRMSGVGVFLGNRRLALISDPLLWVCRFIRAIG